MQIEIKIDSLTIEPKIIIITDKMTDEINSIVKKLSADSSQIISGFRGDILEVLEQIEIIRIYANGGKVFAATNRGEFTLRLCLYELDNRLDKTMFIRISNSEIINLKKVKGFDLSFAGTICVKMLDDTVTYVSRRYVAKIKQVLGI